MRFGVRSAAVVAIAIAVLVGAACEARLSSDLATVRDAAGVAPVVSADDLLTAARAHSQAMCAAGAVSPTADIPAAYLGQPATRLRELVGAAPLEPSAGDAGQQNAAATDAIWAQWRNDPTLIDPQWQAVGVGEAGCADGYLYMTLVLRNDPPAFDTVGDTSQIQQAETVDRSGWRFVRYRNLAYPCAISGFQSFVIGTKIGSSATATRPLWVRMRGGGVGWFDDDGSPLPTSGVKSEESMNTQLSYDDPGLMANVKAGPEGFRVALVSMCSHDIYAGNDNYDPYNPNLTPDGQTRPVNGLRATTAAIAYTQARFPTDDVFLHGTSAGGAGTWNVAWAMQQQGNAPAGLISDSGVLNQSWQRYVFEHGVSGTTGCEKATEERGYGVLGRIDRQLGDPANEPHLLVSSGRLSVPALHLWNRNDKNVCGNVPMPCPVPDGSAPWLSAADCNHEPMRRAIASLGPSTRSLNVPVCVEGGDAAIPCDRHVVSGIDNGVNSDPATPADYQSVLIGWVRARLADD